MGCVMGLGERGGGGSQSCMAITAAETIDNF